MIAAVLIAMVVVITIGLVLFARHAKSVDQDIRSMNTGRGPGPGIFGIMRRHRQV